MTCIVGLVHEGITYIGGDSMGSNGYSYTIRKDPKVFKLKDSNNAIIGYTSSFRMGQILMYATGLLDARDVKDDLINHEYLATKFITNVATAFQKGGYGREEKGEKEGGCFLFGYNGNLYKIESDFQVGEGILPYEACGCGQSYALGSLHSTEGSGMSPEDRIHAALRAASSFSTGVGAPYLILNTDNDVKVCYND